MTYQEFLQALDSLGIDNYSIMVRSGDDAHTVDLSYTRLVEIKCGGKTKSDALKRTMAQVKDNQ